jgi:carbonic anhydrase
MQKNEVTAGEALRRLREGNARFVSGTPSVASLSSQMNREAHAAGQQPFAIILTCSDSRVPTEMIFDQGIGDLFVIRVAGNVVAPSLVGSVEFAAATFGTHLAVVMGHTSCGAVKATLDVLAGKTDLPSENIRDIVDRIRPAATAVVEASRGGDVLPAAIRANVRTSVEHLRRGSRVLEEMVRKGEVTVVGAEYDLVSGVVDFFEVPPDLA